MSTADGRPAGAAAQQAVSKQGWVELELDKKSKNWARRWWVLRNHHDIVPSCHHVTMPLVSSGGCCVGTCSSTRARLRRAPRPRRFTRSTAATSPSAGLRCVLPLVIPTVMRCGDDVLTSGGRPKSKRKDHEAAMRVDVTGTVIKMIPPRPILSHAMPCLGR